MEKLTGKEREKILNTIHQLSKIANPENNAFEGEIANAAAAMQKLMEKYSISIEEVFASGNKEIDEAFKDAKSDAMFGSILKWHWFLGHIICKITHTKYYSAGKYSAEGIKTLKGSTRNWGKTIGFFGRESNVAMACALFTEWLIKLNSMAEQATSKYCHELLEMENSRTPEARPFTNAYHIPDLGSSHPNVFRASWLQGCLETILTMLEQQENSRDSRTSTALAIYDAKIAEKWAEYSADMKTKKHFANSLNLPGYLSGKAAGAAIHIGQKSVPSDNQQLSD